MGKFSIELFEQICDEIAISSKGLNHICKKHGTTSRSFFRWIRDDEDKEESERLNLRLKYTCAREDQADYLADEIIEISDDSEHDTISTDKGDFENKEWVNRSKLRVEARKWVASKLKPKKYGEKLDLTTDGEKLPPPQSIPIVLQNGKTIEDLMSELEPE